MNQPTQGPLSRLKGFVQTIHTTPVGLRVLKTALAVGVCLTLRQLLGSSRMEYAAIAAVLALQQTPEQSFRAGVNRLVGTLVGALGGFLVLTLSNWIPGDWYLRLLHILIIPMGLVLVSWLCLNLKQIAGVALSSVTYLSLVTNFSRTVGDTGLFVTNRVVETSLGIVVAVLVDFFVFPNAALRAQAAADPPAPASPGSGDRSREEQREPEQEQQEVAP